MFMENILEIKNLNIFFDKYQALYNVNLNLEKGILHALVGESGCGKTLTAMSIMRLLPKAAEIKEGKILFNNENLLDYKERQMRDLRGDKIALIPQDPMTSLNPLYTIGNQLVESIRAHRKVSHNQALRKAKEVLDLVKIPDVENKLNFYPHEFSGGMKQRVLLARALCASDRLLILDEPVTGLDCAAREELYENLLMLKKSGMTIIMVTHDLNAALKYADKILHIGQHGNFFGTADEYMKSDYIKTFTEGNK